LASFFLNLSTPDSHYSQQRAATPDPASSNLKKVHQTVITVSPDWMGSIALCEHITGVFSLAEKPFKDTTRCLFLMNMKRLVYTLLLVKKMFRILIGEENSFLKRV
jgi:hypothetical protein